MSLHFPTWLQRINDAPLELLPTLPYASVEKAPCQGIAVQATDLSASARPDGHLAFEQATLEIPCGCRAALIGPNGSGKSTVLRVLAGLIKPRSGKVQVLGSPPALGRSRVAYLSQRPTFTENFPLQLRRLVQMGTYAHHGWFEECHHGNQGVNRALELMGLTDLADRPVHTLSGGQLQRGLLARATVQGAEILLLDEPFAALDQASRDIVEKFLFDQGHAFTVIMATHDPADSRRFDRILEIRNGTVTTTHSCAGHGPHHHA
ncbi:MAG: ATP-binding cassette domain-containing protein [Verrucomicrobia bacterium]|nr:ATP-binding cassette domain-containing protein [Verrucomicrobiota bacterium]